MISYQHHIVKRSNIKLKNFLIQGFKHIFWSVIVCVAMGCAAIFLYSNTIDFMNATVVTTVDTMTVPLSEVFFPSVVVCNINQVSISMCYQGKKNLEVKPVYANSCCKFFSQIFPLFCRILSRRTFTHFLIVLQKNLPHNFIK